MPDPTTTPEPTGTPVRALPAIDLDDATTRAGIARAQAGEPLDNRDMMAIFRIKHARFHQLVKNGTFDLFLLKPSIGNKRYSGVKVYRHLCGDPVYEPTFGRKRRA